MTDENRMTLSILVQDGDFVQSYRCASRQAAVDLVRHLAAEHPAHELREEIVDPVPTTQLWLVSPTFAQQTLRSDTKLTTPDALDRQWLLREVEANGIAASSGGLSGILDA